MSTANLIPTANLHELLVREVVDYAIYMLNPTGHVVTWNAGAARIKGYSQAEILGAHFSLFYTPEDRAEGVPDRALRTAVETGRFVAEGWRCRKDGSRFWAMVVIDAIYDQGVLIGFAKITRDLTERRQAQLELEASREQLFQAQKMEAVGQLTGGLAHDFNNLLTGIIGSLSLMEARLAAGQTAELSRYITAAQGAASRAAALTHRLLAFARRQTLDPTVTQVDRLIGAMAELLQNTVGDSIVFKLDFAPDLWPVLCDANQLEGAILNLCINARDAMPAGGSIRIEAENMVLDEAEARSQGVPAGAYVAISVIDDGAGMPPDVLARAFDPFFTTKPLGQGTGLGLSMIHGFAKQSGGQARIFSEPGCGTTVRIYLPNFTSANSAESIEQASLDLSSAGAGQATVLVVDDEPAIRMLIVDVLGELGYRLLEEGDAAGGLAVLRSDRPIDLLITDVGLPGGMNGRQMADAGRELRPDLKVLFITGYAEAAIMGGGQFGPGMQVLAKPFAMNLLAERVNAILR
ncbi:MAG TPA: ATP-binding protein [Acidisoma sp.]|uniref:PAS domain-containing sensor histidine kinase n=1 Tax=Acidisoma sp. TaxID=1872115 RepID=UPI002C1BD895|nr:ATP-binding protein [Acidisoma sp.]HTH99734.1 ATP-binding protein [Acidisoma sp.]